jgi:hypothetical protein
MGFVEYVCSQATFLYSMPCVDIGFPFAAVVSCASGAQVFIGPWELISAEVCSLPNLEKWDADEARIQVKSVDLDIWTPDQIEVRFAFRTYVRSTRSERYVFLSAREKMGKPKGKHLLGGAP